MASRHDLRPVFATRFRACLVRPLSIACFVVAAGVVAAGQNRDTVETKVTAERNVIVLEWSDKHPWHAQLLARGVSLVAEYRTRSRGIVSEVLGSGASRRRDERSARFQLPDAPTSVPLGAICLYIQLPTRQLLPIRRASSQRGDTARFRYEAWEREASKRAVASALRAGVSLTGQKIAANEQDIATQERIVARTQRTTLAACETVPLPPESVERPYDVVEPSLHDDMSRQVCVLRAANGERFDDYALVRTPGLLERLLQLLPPEQLTGASIATRLQQLAEFRRDWNRWEPQLAAYRSAFPQPHFGGRADTLDLQTTTFEAAGELRAGRNPDSADIAGYVGGALEAYGRCVEDGRKQLRTKYDSWQALSSSAPMRAQLARQQLVAACQRDVTTLDRLKAANLALRKQLENDEAALTQATASVALPSKAQALNTASCTLE
jgi:hypothetical protein